MKVNEAGLVKKKECDGDKWVYYKMKWKGEGLLYIENISIVVLFSETFFTLLCGFIKLLNFESYAEDDLVNIQRYLVYKKEDAGNISAEIVEMNLFVWN